jgi:hypothetical protein
VRCIDSVSLTVAPCFEVRKNGELASGTPRASVRAGRGALFAHRRLNRDRSSLLTFTDSSSLRVPDEHVILRAEGSRPDIYTPDPVSRRYPATPVATLRNHTLFIPISQSAVSIAEKPEVKYFNNVNDSSAFGLLDPLIFCMLIEHCAGGVLDQLKTSRIWFSIHREWLANGRESDRNRLICRTMAPSLVLF